MRNIKTLGQFRTMTAVLFVLVTTSSHDHAVDADEAKTAVVASLLSDDGKRLLLESTNQDSFILLSTNFECQENLSFCGPATIVTILNSTDLPRPPSSRHPNYFRFDQNNIFKLPKTPPKDQSSVRTSGMSLAILEKFFRLTAADATAKFASDVTVEDFRLDLQACLQTSGQFMAVNYLRTMVGQAGGGHISPIAAYNESEDAVLILDVSKYKYPPVWVKLNHLFRAMETSDGAKSRGYVLIVGQASKIDHQTEALDER